MSYQQSESLYEPPRASQRASLAKKNSFPIRISGQNFQRKLDESEKKDRILASIGRKSKLVKRKSNE